MPTNTIGKLGLNLSTQQIYQINQDCLFDVQLVGSWFPISVFLLSFSFINIKLIMIWNSSLIFVFSLSEVIGVAHCQSFAKSFDEKS